jgi:hypothetical protein
MDVISFSVFSVDGPQPIRAFSQLMGVYLTTLPPAALHSLADAFAFQPMPLQLFNPLHSFLAVLQSEVPLQLLMPAQCTDMSSACATVIGALTANRAAAALAMARVVLKLLVMVFVLCR